MSPRVRCRLILLVDDNPRERSCTKLLLETARGGAGCRYSVLPAMHAEALQVFAAHAIDLALIQSLPENPLLFAEMGGVEVAEAIKRQAPLTPVILFSRERALPPWQHPADWIFDARNSTPAALLARIEILLRRKRGPKSAFAVFEQQRSGGAA